MTVAPLSVRLATAAEATQWDSLIDSNPAGSRFQNSLAFAATKQQFGWQVRQVVFTDGMGTAVSYAQVLARRVPLLGTLWYLPAGPAALDTDSLAAHTRALTDFAGTAGRRVFTILMNPPMPAGAVTDGAVSNLGLVPVPPVQGDTHTAIVDLTPEPAELLASFEKSCRNLVRRAERDGLEITNPSHSADTFAQMHELMRLVGGGTAELYLRSKTHTESLWHEFERRGQGRFYSVSDETGKPAVMAYMVLLGSRAFYKDGGSDRPRTTPGMSNLVLWRMMLDAKEHGATEIDLYGIAPEWAKSTADHPSYGLGRFKLSFARARTDYVGALEVPLKPLKHRLWRKLGARATAKLYRQKYGDITLY